MDGWVMDVRTAAEFIGTLQNEEITEGTIRSRIRNGTLPHRRWGGRIVLIREELEAYFRTLPGVNLEQAIENTRRASR